MRLLFCLMSFLMMFSSASHAEDISDSDLLRHIEILASDEFGGRKPGTDGENMTVNYIATQWKERGLNPAAGSNAWYAPVDLVERAPVSQTVKFVRSKNGRERKLSVGKGQLILRGNKQFGDVTNGQIVYAGYGLGDQEELEQLISGKIALIPLTSPKEREDIADYRVRKKRVIAAGAWAVLTIVDGGRDWRRTARRYQRPSTTLAGEFEHAIVEGIISKKLGRKLLKTSGLNPDGVIEQAKLDGFRPIALPIYADLSAETTVRSYQSHNVVGKIPGTNPDSGAVLFAGHWDHLGQCRRQENEGAEEDLICNGAVDNASGISLLIEVAGKLAQTSPDRDIYFLATTAEEMGLLGARAFVANPPVPLDRLVAVFNADTVALAPDGELIAVIGRGKSTLDEHIEKIADMVGRTIDKTDSANAYVKRQDGYVFLEKGVPTYMITSAFSDQERLDAYLAGPYHDVTDEVDDELLLGGATDDANFHVALGRYFASTETYPEKATSE